VATAGGGYIFGAALFDRFARRGRRLRRNVAACPHPRPFAIFRLGDEPQASTVTLMPEKRYLLAAIVIIAIILILAFVRL
jgi:hypothetical protein